MTRWLSVVALLGLLFGGEAGSAAASKPQCGGDNAGADGEPARSRAYGAYAMTSDGGRFAVTVDDGRWSGLFVFDVATGKLAWQHALSTPASSIALSPTGNALAIAYTVRPSGCSHVELFSGIDGQDLALLQDRGELSSIMNDAAQAVVFAPDGARVAAALRNAVRVWNVSSGRNVSDIEPPGSATRQGIEPVGQLLFSPDGQRIAGVSGRRPAVYVWDVRTRRLERTLTLGKFAGGFGSIVFNGNGSLLAAGSTGPIAIWRWRAGALIGEIAPPPAGPIGPVAFLSDMKLVVNGPGKLELWDVSKRILARDPDWHSPEEIADTAFVVRSGEVVGIVSDSAWESGVSTSGRIRLIAMPSGATISRLEVPGRPTEGSKMP